MLQRVIDDSTELQIAALMSQVNPDDLTEIEGALDAVSDAVSQYNAGRGDETVEIQCLEAISACAAAMDKVAIEMREDRADTSKVSPLGQIKEFG